MSYITRCDFFISIKQTGFLVNNSSFAQECTFEVNVHPGFSLSICRALSLLLEQLLMNEDHPSFPSCGCSFAHQHLLKQQAGGSSGAQSVQLMRVGVGRLLLPTEPEHKSTPILAKVINLWRVTYVSQCWDEEKLSLTFKKKNKAKTLSFANLGIAF